jgi:hypothetical protein
MIDEFTFAFRYRCRSTFSVHPGSRTDKVPMPITVAVVDWLKSLNLWDEVSEAVIGPYVIPNE